MKKQVDHYIGELYECIDIIRLFQLGYVEGNILKYIWRRNKKGCYDEDMGKVIHYISFLSEVPPNREPRPYPNTVIESIIEEIVADDSNDQLVMFLEKFFAIILSADGYSSSIKADLTHLINEVNKEEG